MEEWQYELLIMAIAAALMIKNGTSHWYPDHPRDLRRGRDNN